MANFEGEGEVTLITELVIESSKTYLMAKIQRKDTVVNTPPITGPIQKPIVKRANNMDCCQLLSFRERESDRIIRTTWQGSYQYSL